MPEARAGRLRSLSGRSFVAKKPARLGVAVSGGGDSMALLDLMIWHAAQRGFEIEAATVDHGLRPESALEAASVAHFCVDRSIRHEVLHWRDGGGRGNLPARAREARYHLIAGWAKRRNLGMVVLGHTRDDVAETFLMRLGRAAGLDGLSAMDQDFDRLGVAWSRPLLQCDRGELREYLADRDIRWHEDPTNEDPSYDRTKARDILAVLSPLGIEAGTLAQVAENLGSARAALEHSTWKAAPELVQEDRGDLVLKPNAIPRHPSEIHRRLLSRALQWVSGSDYPPRQSAMVSLGAELAQAGRHTLAGCLVTRSEGSMHQDMSLRIAREWNAVKSLVCLSDQVWDGRWRLDGPHAPHLEIRALGPAVSDCPNWRNTGLPRTSLLASPAVWSGVDLVAAPLAGMGNGWSAALAPPRADFVASLL